MTPRPVGRLTMTLFVCLIFWGESRCFAQKRAELTLPKITAADFTLPASSIIDSSSDAVILADLGDIRFIGSNNGWFSNVFVRHTRIKILNKKAFDDVATVRLIIYQPQDDPEKLEKVVASTYTLENGQVVEVKLDKKDIFEERYNKNYVIAKFTLPAVREGSIIDYSYSITSNYNDQLPTWHFQSERYPCLSSELNVDIPQTLYYVIFKQGVHPYAVDKGNKGYEFYIIKRKDGDPTRLTANTTIHQWVMKDIPAFRAENFLSCPENYVDKIDLQLTKTYNGEDFEDYYSSWKLATDQLLREADFGRQLEDDDPAVNECVTKALANTVGLREQARQVYYYVCQHFTCSNYRDKYVRTSLGDVVRKQSGTVGDINLLLITMLRKIGLTADPVLLSTRDFGFNLASYPELQQLNYVIARVKLEGKVIYLDAAHPMLGFGQLDGNCYNGHARIISKVDSGSVFFEADSLREPKTTVVFVTATDKGEEGTWSTVLGPQESYKLREKVDRKGVQQYFKDIQTSYGEDVSISEGGIDSLDRPEDPVTVHYSLVLHQGEGGASKIYVNPFIGAGEHENPFKAADRKYPVEMPYARDETYVYTMQVPEGYSVEELPKSTRASLNGSDGSFEYLIGEQAGMVQLRCRLKLNKANFPASDYVSLREFFGLVVKKEAEAIVLKKN